MVKPNNLIIYAQNHSVEIPDRCLFRLADSQSALTWQPFLFMRDPLFLVGCAAYAFNRWLVKPHVHTGFFHSHFNDCWLIPCALPPILWLHRRLGLRSHDVPPQICEITLHLAFWSLLFEWVSPRFVPHTTGDPLDALAYAMGAVLAGLWWRRRRWLNPRLRHEL